MLTIRLSPHTEQRLQELATKAGRTRSSLVREAIVTHLDDLEDLYLVERRLADFHAGRTQAIPIEQVMRAYKLAVV